MYGLGIAQPLRYPDSADLLDLQRGKRYVPEKEYIHMISSYITADWSNIE